MTEIIIPLISLIALEVILGIDNIIFISILADKLPENQRLDQPLFSLFETSFTGKGLILIAGGLFLIYKSTKEIYHKSEIASEESPNIRKKISLKNQLTKIRIILQNSTYFSTQHILYNNNLILC
jgi:predicted tellurium resistance membrane protein TerC